MVILLSIRSFLLVTLLSGLSIAQGPASAESTASDPAEVSLEQGGGVGIGSVYVSLDSWVYPALNHLAAIGYIPDHVSNIGPLTRRECRRQVEQALTKTSTGAPQSVLRLIADLRMECQDARRMPGSVRLESVYSRSTIIQGSPLRDGYHFGQTVSNDYGRPYDRGFNNISGLSAYAGAGPVFAYFRGEFQHAGGRDGYSLPLRQFISGVDGNPLRDSVPIARTNRFQPLEAYVGLRAGFETITVGKQDIWWGPGVHSAYSFSSNAEPFYSVRFSQNAPLVLPGPLARFGKIRTEVVFGKLSGHQWPPRPLINAQKISFELTDNLEVGLSRSAIFGGVGHPLTIRSIASSLFSTTSTTSGRKDPGDRHSGFDIRYRIPGFRRYLTIYSDSFADDEVLPQVNPRRSVFAPGLHIAQIPGLKGFDLRFETYSTWLFSEDHGGTFMYFNGDYHDSYTNNGLIFGSWVGRDARAYVASSTYWISGKSRLEGQYRQIKTGNGFLPGGGTQTDGSVSAQWGLTSEWLIAATTQYERYFVPILGPARQVLLGSFSLIFTPRESSSK